MLAEAGLLDGRRATTHWMDAPLLASRYPQVRVDPDVLYVDEGQVLTSAGIACGIDLCLHVVRKDFGAAVAATVARRLVVPPHRDGSQAQFVDRAMVTDDTGSLDATRQWARTRLGKCPPWTPWRGMPHCHCEPSPAAFAPRSGHHRYSGC